jgi:glycosyltransferase involved in cell wall biosynthesis
MFAGRLIPEKRAHLLPSVLKELRKTGDWHGVIFGEGSESARIQGVIQEQQVAPWIKTPGFADWADIEQSMNDAAVFIFPSAREGFGIVALEAMAHGLPVIVVEGEDNATTELICPGVNGEVVSSAHPQMIAQAAERLMAQKNIYQTTTQWYQENKARYNPQAAGENLVQLWREFSKKVPH